MPSSAKQASRESRSRSSSRSSSNSSSNTSSSDSDSNSDNDSDKEQSNGRIVAKENEEVGPVQSSMEGKDADVIHDNVDEVPSGLAPMRRNKDIDTVTGGPSGGRTGGVYVPPFKLAMMRKAMGAVDKSSQENQKQSWEALRKSINGLINKVNVSNIKHIIPELFQENLVRGRGLFARAIMKAQLASPGFTHIYSALLAIVNTKLPENGELVLKRVIYGFKRAYKRSVIAPHQSLSSTLSYINEHGLVVL